MFCQSPVPAVRKMYAVQATATGTLAVPARAISDWSSALSRFLSLRRRLGSSRSAKTVEVECTVSISISGASSVSVIVWVT
jgi:hypothetical protein